MSDEHKLATYKAVGFVTKSLLAVNALAAGMLYFSPSYWIMTLLGLGVTTQASLVLIHRHVIMDEYVHELDNKEDVSVWRKPSQAIYRVNIYLIWPLLLVAGVVMLVIGFISL